MVAPTLREAPDLADIDPPIALDAVYIETPFARRLSHALERARRERCGFVIAARSGAGKSTELKDYLALSPVTKLPDGTTSAPVITAIPDTEARSNKPLALSLLEGIGVGPPRSRGEVRAALVTEMGRCGTELIVVDDAHGLVAADLLLIKQVTDDLLARHDRSIGWVLLCAGSPGHIPLRELINQPTLQWSQLRRRMSRVSPWGYLPALSADELSDVLSAYESVAEAPFPGLRLVRWTSRIHRHLCHPFFDPDGEERVLMQNVRDLLDLVLRMLVQRDLADVPADGRLIDEAVALLQGAPEVQEVRTPSRSRRAPGR